jgi:hypothetical protein
MKSSFLALIPIISCMAFTAFAEEATDATSIEIGMELKRFDYREFDQQDKQLLREYGVIPGIRIGTEHESPSYTTRFILQRFDRDVDYDGHTQSGNPLSTQSKEIITNFELSIHPKLQPVNDFQPGLALGVGYREWNRGIQPTATTTSLHEIYRWGYWLMGMNMQWRTNRQWTLGINAEALQPFNPHIEVHVPGYDATTLHLNSKQAYRLSLPIGLQAPNKLSWRITPYWQTWHMGRSDSRPLRINSNLSGLAITEPESKTNIWGISISTRFK